MKSLILAGGFATRLYPVTMNKAKALLEFKGKPVINHIINAIPENIDVMVTINKKFKDDFSSWLVTIDRPVEVCIEEAVNDDQKKGAVSAIDFWIKNKNINQDLLVIAADNYFEFHLSELIAQYNGKNTLIAVYDVGDKEKACEIGKSCQVGLAKVENNKIISFDEKPLQATSSMVATGIYVLPTRIFPLLSKYCSKNKRDNMGHFISHLMNIEEVHAFVFDRYWLDIGEEIKSGRLAV
jgi:glucose-1-phosphate thymidylyltransferase